MAVNLNIQATIVDIISDNPKPEDVFLVDTNVWYWMTYPKATCHVSSHLSDYPGYMNKALGVNARIYHSGLSLAELAHLIETAERKIYEGATASITTKEYRHNMTGERSQVVAEIQAAWGQVSSLADPLVLTIDGPCTTAALNRFHTQQIDGYDLFMLEAMNNHGVVQVITDDGDFATVPGIQVFTANRNVITTARKNGKLLRR